MAIRNPVPQPEGIGARGTVPEGRPLEQMHAVVTGGGRGIGAAIAWELAALGARLTLMGRQRARLEATGDRLREAHGVDYQAIPVDVTDPTAVSRAFAESARSMGAPSILVNNAGAALSAPLVKTDDDLWGQMINVNLTGPFLCCRAVLPEMLAAKFGRIVNLASTAGLRGYAYVSAYCASKHGLIGLTRSLALETATSGVTVNAVCPGYTDTDLVSNAIDNIAAKSSCTQEEALAGLVRFNPQGRLIRPEEVARSVGWLCLPGQGAVTGQSLIIAGGEVM